MFTRAVELLPAGAKSVTPSLAIVLQNLAVLQGERGRTAEARRRQAGSDGIMSRLFGERRPRVLNSPTLPGWSCES